MIIMRCLYRKSQVAVRVLVKAAGFTARGSRQYYRKHKVAHEEAEEEHRMNLNIGFVEFIALSEHNVAKIEKKMLTSYTHTYYTTTVRCYQALVHIEGK